MAVSSYTAGNPADILKCFRLSGVEKTGKTIGRGSYAHVIELRYRELKCAGKELYPVPLPTDDLSNGKDKRLAVLERVKKECDMLSSVKHPNIVQFMGVYFDEGNPLPVLVMEFVPFTLSQHLEDHKPYPPEISYGILIDVAKALCYLHGGKPVIIHRDLSANNVLLTYDMSAKVSDLGTAKRLSEKLNQHQTRCPGTLIYMPPEAYKRDSFYDETLDCFSYGVLMLHIFTGEWPEARDVPGGGGNGQKSEISRRQKFIDKMGSDHPLTSLVYSCLSVPSLRPSAKQILEKVNEIKQRNCRPKTDKLSLLRQTEADRADKREQTIAELRSKQQNMEDQHAIEVMESANKIEELLNDVEELKSFVEVLKKDRKVEEDRVNENEEKIAILKNKMEAEIDAVKKRAEEEMNIYKETKDREMNIKEQELRMYKEILQEKEQRLDDIIQRATERQIRYKSERTSNKIHPLHHLAKKIRWRKLPELPMGMTAPQCVQIESSLYIGGGQTVHTDKELRQTIFEYDTTGNNGNIWKTRFPKSPTMHFGLGELEDKLVVVGGQREAEDKRMIVTGEVFMLDESESWSRDIIPPMKIPRMRACVVSYKGHCIAACGGLEVKSSRDCSSEVEIYRSDIKEWCIVNPLPAPRAALRATVIHKTVYLLGGFCPDLTGVSERDCVSIDLENLFQADSTLPRLWKTDFTETPHHSSAPANICGALSTIGGAQNRQTQARTDAICAYSPVVNKWYHIDNLPVKLSSATAVTLTSGEVVVVGGRLGEERNANVYIGSLD